MSETITSNTCTTPLPARYVRAEKLLELLFDESCRPSMRTVRNWQKQRRIPFVKLGHSVYFDPVICRAAINNTLTVKGRRN